MSSSTRSSLDPLIPNAGQSRQLGHQTATVFAALTVVYVVFILYASFAFGGSRAFSLSEGLTKLSGITDTLPRLRFHALRDISTNILLYIPLGVFLACRLAALNSLRLTTPWLLFGSGISIFAEFTQLFINRSPDPVDLMTNTAGYVAGFSLTLWAIRKYQFEVSSVLGLESAVSTKVQMLQAIRFLYAGIYLIVQLLPLDISVSMTGVYAKLAAPPGVDPRIIVDPLYHFHSDAVAWHQILLEFLGILPLGVLSGSIYRFRERWSWIGPPAFCLTFILCAETAKVFVTSATTDVSHLALALAAGLIGSLIVTVNSDLPRRFGLQSELGAPKTAALLCGLYALCLLSYMLSPYEFEPDLRHIYAKVRQEINWIPFYAHLSVRNIHSAVDIVREVLLYVPIGVLISFAGRHAWTRRQAAAISLIIGLSLGVFNELAQVVVVYRVVDITDVLLASLGCAAGAWVGFAFWERRTSCTT